MKIGLIFIIFFGLLVSCKKKSDKCNYVINSYIDTTLFVKFKFNNQEMRYYQYLPLLDYGWNRGTGPRHVDDNTAIIVERFDYFINFISYPKEDIPGSVPYPELSLIFSKKTVRKTGSPFYGPSIRTTFTNMFGFAKRPDYLVDKDTLYFNGAVINLSLLDSATNQWHQPSTSNVFDYYHSNNDSIDSFFKDSFIKVLNVEEICDGIFLIEGNFKARLMYPPYYGDNSKVIELTDGEFKFIRHE